MSKIEAAFYQSDCAKKLQAGHTGDRVYLAEVFAAGAAWQKEQDAKICEGLFDDGDSDFDVGLNMAANAIREQNDE